MANEVKFLRGLYSNYNNLTPKDADTLYITRASVGAPYDSLYLGENLIGSTSLGKLPFDAVNYNATYNGENPFTESNLSAATTLLDVIAVLENKIDNATGADNAVTSIFGMTGAVTFSNTFTAADNEAQFAHVVFEKNESSKEIRGKLAINVPELFGESDIAINTASTIENKDLIQIVADTESGNITLAKVKALLADPTEEDESNLKSFLADGLMTMSKTATYVERVVNGDVSAAINTHKSEANAHELKNISSVDETTGKSMHDDITSTTGDWAFAHELLENYNTIADNLQNADNAQELVLALFNTIKASLKANKEYTDSQIGTVGVEWEEIA